MKTAVGGTTHYRLKENFVEELLVTMSRKTLNWGIISAGKISHDFCVAQSLLPKEEHKLVAVAAQDLNRAQEFAERFNMPRAYGSYEEIVKDPEVDVMYIGVIHPMHIELAKLALDNGKHVLCEKPLCMNVKETKELLQYAEDRKLFLMEALWSRFFPAYKKLQEELQKGTIGEVKQVMAVFGVPISDVDRLKYKELGGGTVLDIGLYTIQFASLCFNEEKPERIVSAGHLNDQKVDMSSSTTMLYSKGRQATLVTHSLIKMPSDAFVVGTKGTIKLHDPFWCSTKIEIIPNEGEKKLLEFPLPDVDKEMNFWNSQGLSFQCNEVRRCILEGKIESDVVPHSVTLTHAEIAEEIRRQIGVDYPQDHGIHGQETFAQSA